MRTATTRLGLLVTLVLFAAPVWAQEYQITFQVDMNAAIDNCALDPMSDQVISVAGELNGWSTGVDNLADGDGDGIYGGTFTVNEADLGDDGALQYKFWGTDPVGWENDPNRTVDPTGDVVLDPVVFNQTFTDLCSSETETYEIIFQVDMSVKILQGQFDPETDVVTVAGGFNGWNTSADTLVQDIFNPDIYVGLVESELIVPSEQAYKYIIGEPEDAAPDGWETLPQGGDRMFNITGDETDSDDDDNDFPEKILDVVFFSETTPDDILTAPATVLFEVDLRPAYYHLADSTFLPSDTQTGEPTTSIDGLFINGPFAGSADGLNDWATWGPDDLGQIPTRQLFDDGTNGDVTAGDSIFTLTYEFAAGTSKTLAGKLGINGFDNEAGFGADHIYVLTEGTQTIEKAFGAQRRADGTFTDDNGPVINDQDFSMAYDPYILIDNTATPPTYTVVRRGGDVDNNPVAVEPTGVVPVTAELRGNYPNPFVGRTTFEYAVAEAGHVSLTVYDLMGRRVATLVDGVQTADTYRVSFDASALASGVYVTRLQVGGTVLSQKLTVTN
ncbi:MAG: T9SS type A sorting domain-containing protein [Rhodothermales bacterium]